MGFGELLAGHLSSGAPGSRLYDQSRESARPQFQGSPQGVGEVQASSTPPAARAVVALL